MNEIITFIRDDERKHIAVHFEKCGHNFGCVAEVFEPDSENPLLLLPRPLGFNTVIKIIEHIRNENPIH